MNFLQGQVGSCIHQALGLVQQRTGSQVQLQLCANSQDALQEVFFFGRQGICGAQQPACLAAGLQSRAFLAESCQFGKFPLGLQFTFTQDEPGTQRLPILQFVASHIGVLAQGALVAARISRKQQLSQVEFGFSAACRAEEGGLIHGQEQAGFI